MWSNNYVGLPFKYKGRTEEGLDCWGLARLIYKNEYDITLPSFSEEYEENDVEHMGELIAQYKEGWEPINSPEEGSLVLFRIMGIESHIGVAISNTHFIHSREGQDSAVEAFDSASWSKRIVGHFKYAAKRNAVLNVVPHPLKTQRFTMPVPEGTTLDILANWILKEYNVAEEIKSKVNILVNGRIIQEQDWPSVKLKDSDQVEYRSVPTGGNTTRLLLTLVVLYVAITYGPAVGEAMGFTAGNGFTAAQTQAFGAAAVTVAGTMLVNAIAPIRLPGAPSDPGNSERQLMVDGASNRAAPYSSIPVVLGRVKITPPLGSVNYLTYESERNSYLSMLLTWGYGPLDIETATFKIGDVPITNYTDYDLINLDRKSTETADQLQKFDSIYGKDVTQVQTNIELVCDGNPETVVTPGPWSTAATSEAADSVTVAIHFPQGLRKIKSKGDGAGNSYTAPTTFRIEYFHNSVWSLFESLTLGSDAPKKDAFTFTTTKSIADNGIPINTNLMIRVRRETGDNVEDNPDYRYYHTSILQNVTFIRNATPAVDPVGAKIAKTAFKIKATDQLNGNIEGINAIVQTYCKSWNGSAWVDAATNNPADLFRYVLEHPGNAQRVTDIASKVNLTQLQYWATYCNTHGFEYNSVLGSSKGLLDVLRDICAAGRASPVTIDGKWSVVIDEPRANVIQHFTPHNSWGFESTKALPKLPDGLRVTYYDEDQDFQESEIIVYATGKNTTNAALFESIQLPGVTKKSSVIDHAKWHMAQAQLRPEVYTLNSDIEYIVCTRGDRVKVMHDVPMWGIGSGRIKNRISGTVLELDEEVPMQAGKNYTIRVRSADGSSVVRTVSPVALDGYYSQVNLSSSVTTTEVAALDLFLFGELGSEAVDLVVLSIEPTSNKSARLTLVDYGVTNTYNIYTDYLTLTEATVFESNITLPAKLLIDSFGDKVPTITKLVSDESVMELIAPGVFRYNLSISYVNAAQLPSTAASVEVQYDYNAATNNLSARSKIVPYEKGQISVQEVSEGEIYKIRLRYIGNDGRVGAWSAWYTHAIVGKTTAPGTPTNFVVSPDFTTGNLILDWTANPEIDIKGYEVRTENLGWGNNDTHRVYFGSSTSCFITPELAGTANTFFIKAFDYSNNYSVTPASVTYTVPTPANITGITASFAETSLTSATVTLDWEDVNLTIFALDYYEVSYNGTVKTVKASTINLPANWIGSRTFTIKTVDVHGNKSTGFQKAITKLVPNPATNFRAQVIDNTVMLYWTLPDKTTLPIDHVLLKKGATWETATVIGDKKGAFTTVNESSGGDYTYWIATVDTENNQSTPVSISTKVSEPPDFILHGQFSSTFSATKSSAVIEASKLILPVNTTETWQSHFTSRSWTTPSSQVTAGYPIYIQPANGSGYYEEVFDFGAILASSKITVSYGGDIVSGTPVVSIITSISTNGSTYIDYAGSTEVFGTNFRYVKVRISVNESTGTGLYSLNTLNVRLDAKLISDANTVKAQQSASGTYSQTGTTITVTSASHGLTNGDKISLDFTSGLATDGYFTIQNALTNTFDVVSSNSVTTSGNVSIEPLGTIVNFAKKFIDVQSITLSPSGTTPITAVYDFKDANTSATYSVTSNVCTVTATAHGFITGQNINLQFSTGIGVSGVYTITGYTANTFTVAMTVANTSGNCLVYPESFRVYLFNSAGSRVSGTASWSIKGY